MKNAWRYLAREVAWSTLSSRGVASCFGKRMTCSQSLIVAQPGMQRRHLCWSWRRCPFLRVDSVAALIVLFALAQLASNSEHGVMRTSGVSIAQVGGVLPAVVRRSQCVFVVVEYVVPTAEQLVSCESVPSAHGPTSHAFESGFWSADGNTFINIGSVLPENVAACGACIECQRRHVPGRMLTAETASFLW